MGIGLTHLTKVLNKFGCFEEKNVWYSTIDNLYHIKMKELININIH